MSGLYGNAAGGFGMPKTFILTDSDGNELTGVVVGEETVFDATINDVREGKIFAGDEGVKTGTKIIPYYNTSEGYKIVESGSEFTLELPASDLYDYTKLQCIICPYDSSINNSVSAEKVVIENNVYESNSTTSISTVVKDSVNKTINFGITNDTSILYVIRYFTYKEIE